MGTRSVPPAPPAALHRHEVFKIDKALFKGRVSFNYTAALRGVISYHLDLTGVL